MIVEDCWGLLRIVEDCWGLLKIVEDCWGFLWIVGQEHSPPNPQGGGGGGNDSLMDTSPLKPGNKKYFPSWRNEGLLSCQVSRQFWGIFAMWSMVTASPTVIICWQLSPLGDRTVVYALGRHCHHCIGGQSGRMLWVTIVTIEGQNGHICSGSHNRGKQGGRERWPIMMESCGRVDSRAGQADFFLYALYAF